MELNKDEANSKKRLATTLDATITTSDGITGEPVAKRKAGRPSKVKILENDQDEKDLSVNLTQQSKKKMLKEIMDEGGVSKIGFNKLANSNSTTPIKLKLGRPAKSKLFDTPQDQQALTGSPSLLNWLINPNKIRNGENSNELTDKSAVLEKGPTVTKRKPGRPAKVKLENSTLEELKPKVNLENSTQQNTSNLFVEDNLELPNDLNMRDISSQIDYLKNIPDIPTKIKVEEAGEELNVNFNSNTYELEENIKSEMEGNVSVPNSVLVAEPVQPTTTKKKPGHKPKNKLIETNSNLDLVNQIELDQSNITNNTFDATGHASNAENSAQIATITKKKPGRKPKNKVAEANPNTDLINQPKLEELRMENITVSTTENALNTDNLAQTATIVKKKPGRKPKNKVNETNLHPDLLNQFELDKPNILSDEVNSTKDVLKTEISTQTTTIVKKKLGRKPKVKVTETNSNADLINQPKLQGLSLPTNTFTAIENDLSTENPVQTTSTTKKKPGRKPKIHSNETYSQIDSLNKTVLKEPSELVNVDVGVENRLDPVQVAQAPIKIKKKLGRKPKALTNPVNSNTNQSGNSELETAHRNERIAGSHGLTLNTVSSMSTMPKIKKKPGRKPKTQTSQLENFPTMVLNSTNPTDLEAKQGEGALSFSPNLGFSFIGPPQTENGKPSKRGRPSKSKNNLKFSTDESKHNLPSLTSNQLTVKLEEMVRRGPGRPRKTDLKVGFKLETEASPAASSKDLDYVNPPVDENDSSGWEEESETETNRPKLVKRRKRNKGVKYVIDSKLYDPIAFEFREWQIDYFRFKNFRHVIQYAMMEHARIFYTYPQSVFQHLLELFQSQVEVRMEKMSWDSDLTLVGLDSDLIKDLNKLDKFKKRQFDSHWVLGTDLKRTVEGSINPKFKLHLLTQQYSEEPSPTPFPPNEVVRIYDQPHADVDASDGYENAPFAINTGLNLHTVDFSPDGNFVAVGGGYPGRGTFQYKWDLNGAEAGESHYNQIQIWKVNSTVSQRPELYLVLCHAFGVVSKLQWFPFHLEASNSPAGMLAFLAQDATLRFLDLPLQLDNMGSKPTYLEFTEASPLFRFKIRLDELTLSQFELCRFATGFGQLLVGSDEGKVVGYDLNPMLGMSKQELNGCDFKMLQGRCTRFQVFYFPCAVRQLEFTQFTLPSQDKVNQIGLIPHPSLGFFVASFDGKLIHANYCQPRSPILIPGSKVQFRVATFKGCVPHTTDWKPYLDQTPAIYLITTAPNNHGALRVVPLDQSSIQPFCSFQRSSAGSRHHHLSALCFHPFSRAFLTGDTQGCVYFNLHIYHSRNPMNFEHRVLRLSIDPTTQVLHLQLDQKIYKIPLLYKRLPAKNPPQTALPTYHPATHIAHTQFNPNPNFKFQFLTATPAGLLVLATLQETDQLDLEAYKEDFLKRY